MKSVNKKENTLNDGHIVSEKKRKTGNICGTIDKIRVKKEGAS